MRIYLDTKDLIVLTERSSDAEYEQVANWLNVKGHELVLSLSSILECCVPLTQPKSDVIVTRTLGRIEKLPHKYIAEAKIPRDELASAIAAYSASEDYQGVDPYVSRFDEVVSPFAPPATRGYLRYGLPETVFELWRTEPNLFAQDVRHADMLAKSREADRLSADLKRHDLNFLETVRRTLTQFDINFPPEQVEALSDWIWAQTTRCPSTRWSYELYHQILRNTSDRAGGSDMGDLTHASCLPYVDAMTLDRRMRSYVAQTDRSLDTGYSSKVFADLVELQTKV